MSEGNRKNQSPAKSLGVGMRGGRGPEAGIEQKRCGGKNTGVGKVGQTASEGQSYPLGSPLSPSGLGWQPSAHAASAALLPSAFPIHHMTSRTSAIPPHLEAGIETAPASESLATPRLRIVPFRDSSACDCTRLEAVLPSHSRDRVCYFARLNDHIVFSQRERCSGRGQTGSRRAGRRGSARGSPVSAVTTSPLPVSILP